MLLAAVTLILLARRGRSDDPAHELVAAAQVLCSLEHHNLTVSACRDALAASPLTPLGEATVVMILARTTGEADDVERLRAVSLTWTADVAAQVDVRNLVARPSAGRTGCRFGNVLPAARSGLELLILILMSDENEARGSVFAELPEALADAGLSEVDLPVSDGLPQVTEADLAERAKPINLQFLDAHPIKSIMRWPIPM
jgi:hypothetical protein